MKCRSAASRWIAYGCTALAVVAGMRTVELGVIDQWRRLVLEITQGLGFADPACTTGYCDYTMFWLAGLFVRHGDGGMIYDHARYVAAAVKILPYKSGYWPFVYPPSILPLAMVMSMAPLAAGYYGFCVAVTITSVILLRRAGIAWWCILLGLLSPMAMWNLYLGQWGLLCGALLVAGLVWVQSRPLRAGTMLGILCIKPQYALLVPVVVIAGRHWRAMLAGCVCVLLLLGLSVLCGGADTWLAYLGPGRKAMAALLDQPFGTGSEIGGVSVFWMLRSLHVSLRIAVIGQIAAAGFAYFACWHLWSRPAADTLARARVTVLLSFLASPYGFNDDLAIYAVLLMTLLRRDAPWRNAGLAWLWLLPALVPRFAAATGFLPTPFLILAAVVLAWGNGSAPRSELKTSINMLYGAD